MERYYDLNLPTNSLSALASGILKLSSDGVDPIPVRLARSHEFGFHAVAVNTYMSGKLNNNNTCSFKPVALPVSTARGAPAATATRPGNRMAHSAAAGQPSKADIDGQSTMRQLSRMTYVSDNPSDSSQLGSTSSILASYDIVAVQPLSEKMFLACCNTLDIDLISLDVGATPGGRLGFPLRRNPISQAISRGLFFEVCYSAALSDAGSRRNLIQTASILLGHSKGRNVIFSSAAMRALELRSPLDVANLGCLFGIDQSTSRMLVSSNPSQLLLKCATRTGTYRGVVAARAFAPSAGPAGKPAANSLDALLQTAIRKAKEERAKSAEAASAAGDTEAAPPSNKRPRSDSSPAESDAPDAKRLHAT
ncbi:hypothetical protein H696_02316 [Fonticula alba]|uniref:Uncharacterized protein n=1 Tax=Fonticula alba TaxID=691883 RepID=A0A058ZAG3_FONAL|nr:hypothetical protein H696_02316 [Fonticula alba]KCV71364.1 hypothetical protein H696_02316 [Fonticula alba]|eukprot:XP_009494487.1 hypothetical protein H696_02316 [Fonticula alba]